MNLFTGLLLAAAAAAQSPAEPPGETVSVATTAVADDPRVATADLVFGPGDRLSVRVLDRDGIVVHGSELVTVRDALAVLADRKLAAFWPAVAEFAGRDLERQRARLLARTAQGVRSGASLDEAKALSVRQHFDALSETGRINEGLEEIRPTLARANAGKSRSDGIASLRAGVASELASQGRVGEALALVDAGERRRRAAKPFSGDYRVDRAAILAEAGRHSEALGWIDSARKQALKVDKDADSEVQFAWIRACALAGVGRAEESEIEYRRVKANAPAVRLRLRTLACMGAEDRLAAELIGQLATDEMPSKVALMLRMAEVSPFPWARPFARAARRPDVQSALDARSRPLPAEMIPALRGWAGD